MPHFCAVAFNGHIDLLWSFPFHQLDAEDEGGLEAGMTTKWKEPRSLNRYVMKSFLLTQKCLLELLCKHIYTSFVFELLHLWICLLQQFSLLELI